MADKFHVLRLLHPAINRHRKTITGRNNVARRMLLKNGQRLSSFERRAISEWLKAHPALRELYLAKERLHSFYRIRGQRRAADAFTRVTDTLGDHLKPGHT